MTRRFFALALLVVSCGGKVTSEYSVEVAAGGSGGHAGSGGKHAGGSGGMQDASVADAQPSECAIELASGYDHACAIRSDHTLWCWGTNVLAELGTTQPGNDVRQIAKLGDLVAHVSPGREHSCAVKFDGSVWCWGSNAGKALGFSQGPFDNKVFPDPIQVSGFGVAVQVASGVARSCAHLADGALWCWGSDYGVPMSMYDTGGQVAEAAVSNHTCARKVDGTLWCWGLNENGQVGDGTTEYAAEPKQVEAMDAATVQVSLGYLHTCATKSDHTLWCWGSNLHGGLANWTPGPDYCGVGPCPKPVQVTELGQQVLRVRAGAYHTCAIKLDGSLWCWGHNDHGQIGDGTQGDNVFVPTAVPALGNDVEQVAPGQHHTCARKKDGSIWCWGLNDQGQLGDGTKTDRPTPAPVNLPCPW